MHHPWGPFKVSSRILNVILYWTGSQWRLSKAGWCEFFCVVCERILAAAFWIIWSWQEPYCQQCRDVTKACASFSASTVNKTWFKVEILHFLLRYVCFKQEARVQNYTGSGSGGSCDGVIIQRKGECAHFALCTLRANKHKLCFAFGSSTASISWLHLDSLLVWLLVWLVLTYVQKFNFSPNLRISIPCGSVCVYREQEWPHSRALGDSLSDCGRVGSQILVCKSGAKPQEWCARESKLVRKSADDRMILCDKGCCDFQK